MARRYEIKKKTSAYVWVSLVAVVIAFIGLVLYGFLSGWDAERIFTSNLACMIYAIGALWLTIFGAIKLREWSKK